MVQRYVYDRLDTHSRMTNGCVLTDAGRYRTAIKLAFFLMFLTSVIIFDRGGLYFQCGHTTLKDIPHQFVCQVRSKAQKNCGEINWKIILDVDLPWEQILSSTITSPIPLPLVNLRKRTRPVHCWANLHHHNCRQCYTLLSVLIMMSQCIHITRTYKLVSGRWRVLIVCQQ